jgi:LCP family protein required for cell wall assembly
MEYYGVRRRKKKSVFKRVVLIIVLIIIGLLIAGGLYIYSLLDKVQENPLKETPEELGVSEIAPREDDTGVINILLFGVDARTLNERSRSDTIMIASIDTKNNAVKLTSLMRDMYVEIPGKGKNRINAAYALGGPALAIKTVNTNFDMNITRYATVNFYSLEKIIDQIGGITIDVKKNEIDPLNACIRELNRLDPSGKVAYVNSAGPQTLNGRQAVAYSRIRKVGRDDFERTERQRTVMNEMFKKAKSVGVLKLPGLAEAILPNVETNITKSEMISLGITAVQHSGNAIEQYRLPVDGTYQSQTINGMSVLVPDMEENKKLLHEFIHGE